MKRSVGKAINAGRSRLSNSSSRDLPYRFMTRPFRSATSAAMCSFISSSEKHVTFLSRARIHRCSIKTPPSTFDLRPSTFDLRPSTFDLRPSTFDLRPSTFDLCLVAWLHRHIANSSSAAGSPFEWDTYSRIIVACAEAGGEDAGRLLAVGMARSSCDVIAG